jgi:exodeoxyribonuclease V beta subunit
MRTLRSLLARHEWRPPADAATPIAGIQRAAAERAAAIDSLRHGVASDLAGFDEALTEAWDQRQLKRSVKPTPATWRDRLRPVLAAWLDNPAQPTPDIDPAQIARSTLESGATKGGQLPAKLLEHPIPAAAERLCTAQTALVEAAGPFYAHAAQWVAQRIMQTRRQRGVIGFNDMLTRLRDALAQPEAGPGLAAVIRRQFPMALVDEFQDTDPTQYRILQAIYPADTATGLVLIGDPKQAIYAFRGADLATYQRAAGAIPEDQRHTLARNFRSSEAMVDAVNTLFGRSPMGREPFHPDTIGFQPVSANGRNEALWIAGEPASGMTLWRLETDDDTTAGRSIPVYRRRMAGVAADRIRRLLDRSARGEAEWHDDEGAHPIQPSDVAVLVRTGQEATLIRAALRERGLASVYLSDRDNVLQTQEAGDILFWLQAMAEPESERRVRAALGTASLAYDWPTLEAMFSDDARWEAALEQFRAYADRWRRRGVMPALRQIIHDHGLARRLLVRANGERMLTNLLQITELLQEAAATLDGPAALIRWLDEAMQPTGEAPGDDRILRLESDAALIKVVTIHKSKGLEYPLVFLPFICSTPSAGATPPLIREDEDGATIDFKATDEDGEHARDRQQAEDMRLLYVALTRAVHACWLGIAPVIDGRNARSLLPETAIGRLLGCSGEDALDARLAAVAASSTAIRWEKVSDPGPAGAMHATHGRAPAMSQPWTYSARPPGTERWWIASYSALLEDGPRAAIPGSAEAETLAEETRQDAMPVTSADAPADGAVAAIPPGPATGTLLHQLLEALASRQFPAGDEPAFASIVEQGVRSGRWREWVTPLRDWLAAIVDTPLPLPGAPPLQLTGLSGDAFIAELEFLISVGRVRASRIDAIIRRYTLRGVGRPGLGESALNGMIKGYIDLVVEHEGRFWVLDYKSNALGPTSAHYHPESLERVVREKRYDAQYALYLLALHRLLRARLGTAYDYDTHIGGAVCFFLRGLDSPGCGIHAERPDRALVESLDRLFEEAPQHG